jgi:hypothetical protein
LTISVAEGKKPSCGLVQESSKDANFIQTWPTLAPLVECPSSKSQPLTRGGLPRIKKCNADDSTVLKYEKHFALPAASRRHVRSRKCGSKSIRRRRGAGQGEAAKTDEMINDCRLLC